MAFELAGFELDIFAPPIARPLHTARPPPPPARPPPPPTRLAHRFSDLCDQYPKTAEPGQNKKTCCRADAFTGTALHALHTMKMRPIHAMIPFTPVISH